MDALEYLDKYSSRFGYCDLSLPENKNKNIVVIWSGGCDSTLLLYNILDYLHQNNDHRQVTTYCFTHNQISQIKENNEKKSRDEFIEYIRNSKLSNNLGKSETIKISNDSHGMNMGNSSSCPQPAMWLYSTMSIIQDNSLVFLGYIHGDDFFNITVFKYWYDMYSGLRGLFGKMGLQISFPFINSDKLGVIENLKNLDIYQYCTFCEMPNEDGSECGECSSCVKHNAYLSQYISRKSRNDAFRLKLDDFMSKPIEDNIENENNDVECCSDVEDTENEYLSNN